jgi:DNA-binding NarL/FixJ family response regulator
MNLPEFHTQHVFFASGSQHDYLLFQQVVNELPYLVHLSTAKDGDDTMEVLSQLSDLPDLLILDLDLSIKNGLECLIEIKANYKLGSLPVLIYSPTSHPAAINQLYQGGAHLYLHKAENVGFSRLIQHVLSINWKVKVAQPPREEFVLTL